jgi:hypothetical protein
MCYVRNVCPATSFSASTNSAAFAVASCIDEMLPAIKPLFCYHLLKVIHSLCTFIVGISDQLPYQYLPVCLYASGVSTIVKPIPSFTE